MYHAHVRRFGIPNLHQPNRKPSRNQNGFRGHVRYSILMPTLLRDAGMVPELYNSKRIGQALHHGGTNFFGIHIDDDIHIRLLVGPSAAIEDRHAVSEVALDLDIAM